MANTRIGSHPSFNNEVVETITEAKQLKPVDSGKLFIWDQGDYTVTLPKMSIEIAGWNITMTRRTHSNDDFIVSNHADDSANNIYAIETKGTQATGTTAVSQFKAEDSDTATGGTPAFIRICTDGSYWYCLLDGPDNNHFHF